MKMHKHLKFLGLFATNASIFDEVRDQDGQYFLRDIWVHFFLILKLKNEFSKHFMETWQIFTFSNLFNCNLIKKKRAFFPDYRKYVDCPNFKFIVGVGVQKTGAVLCSYFLQFLHNSYGGNREFRSRAKA